MNTTESLQDRRIVDIQSIVAPARLRQELPLPAPSIDTVARGRDTAAAILDRRDPRLLVIVGPCSVHDPVAGVEYARRLRDVAARLDRQLCIVMRAYFEKPRTTIGWKGLINDPHLDGSFAVNDGLRTARRFLLDVVDLGLAVGCEFLDPITPQYLADTVSWGSIGARTAQSQIHRQLASGLSMPVGIKNTTDGDVQAAVDAVQAAGHGHVFPGIDDDGVAALFTTAGNADCHVILRGGAAGPNCDEATITDTLARLQAAGVPERVVIDASHGNSAKDHTRQPAIVSQVASMVAAGQHGIVGVMIESFLAEGRQELVPGHADRLVFGQSVTDACVGWDATVTMLDELADAVAARSSNPRLVSVTG